MLTSHKWSIIFRREYPQLKGIIERMTEILGDRDGFNSTSGIWRLGDGKAMELAAVQREEDKIKFQGRPHDMKAFDEITHFTESQYRFLIGWVRTADPSQRCRVLVTGNPPTTPEGEWVIRYWAPWLDENHPRPAKPGELRWFAMLDGVDVEVESGDAIMHDGEEIKPSSRTFIPARVEDNKFLMATGYKRNLQKLPEPLRSRMLKGKFSTKTPDHPWQLIPTSWLDAAIRRWEAFEGQDPGPLDALGVDVARGGDDETVIVPRHGHWFDFPRRIAGGDTPTGIATATLVGAELVSLAGAPPKTVAPIAAPAPDRSPWDEQEPEAGEADNATVAINIDVIGVGASAFDALTENGLDARAFNASERSETRDRTGQLTFANQRARWYWALREALDPDTAGRIMLPPDRQLRSELLAIRWKLGLRGIQVEPKDDIVKRIGRSPDSADATVYALADLPGPGSFFLFSG